MRREKERELQAAGKQDLPWPLYLVLSVLVAIASVRWLWHRCHRPASLRVGLLAEKLLRMNACLLAGVCWSQGLHRCAAMH